MTMGGTWLYNTDTPVYLAALLPYLAVEVLELSGKSAINYDVHYCFEQSLYTSMLNAALKREVVFFSSFLCVLFSESCVYPPYPYMQGSALTFQSIDNVHGCDCLPLGVIFICDCIMGDISQE